MARKDRPQDNQGGEVAMDALSQGAKGAAGRTGLNVDLSAIKDLRKEIAGLASDLKDASNSAKSLKNNINGVTGRGGVRGAISSAVGALTDRSTSNSLNAIPGRTAGPATAGGVGGGGGLGGLTSLVSRTGGYGAAAIGVGVDLGTRGLQYMDRRIERGAEYALQADRMSVQLGQMYGMSNQQVRSQLRMPLTSHYLLGGGTAINDLLGMQASTGLSASRQASTVEALRTVSGFSYSSGDITKMLTTMASPDVANRMFMMGGTGIYGIGGTQRSGMQVIQNLVRRAGLTNPEALKGALQPGSNTRQRLTAMGVPQDMQDMVIQYAMQNTQFQKKTGGKGMYDPSQEENRRTMGIEGTYAMAHEKTTGERLKAEEKFYDKQTGALSNFERNMRTATKTMEMFDSALSGLYSTLISLRGHPGTAIASYAGSQVIGSLPGGDPTPKTDKWGIGGDSDGKKAKPNKNNEAKLAQLDSRLAEPLRQMLAENPKLHIGDAKRSSEQQERSFRARYTPHPELKEKTKDADRIWNGVVWVHDEHGQKGPAMAPPGMSWHERGLAADVFGDDAWIIANAARFGLGHGGTGTGGKDDEPFHIQPASTMGKVPGEEGSPSTSDTGSVNTSVTKASVKTTGFNASNASFDNSSSSAYVAINAGEIASSASKEGVTKSVSSIIAGIDKTYTPKGFSKGSPASSAPQGGDATVRGQSGIGGGGYTITVSPTINFNGSQSSTNDLRKIAKEVSDLLEHEIKLVMMRSS